MLRNNSSQSRMWDPEGIRNVGMEPTGEFIFAGVDAEPVNEWDSENSRFTDKVVGWTYPVVQNWVNKETGEVYRQNQIEVAIDDPQKLDLEFGDKVRFEGLGGFYSRKSRKFRAHAEKIEKVKK
ncbi:hypothetical protein NM957_00065 (plasmid) [Limosilactobacillus reuteri]|uniref:hypothetical protein n=1 Tax=Limosilactobacillus reuteri TaxID=1598 RepID=UPI003D8131CB